MSSEFFSKQGGNLADLNAPKKQAHDKRTRPKAATRFFNTNKALLLKQYQQQLLDGKHNDSVL
jgi:hypothetical protein